MCEQAGVEVARELAAPLPPVQADPGQLRQVVVNLVANAVQSMPTGGRLSLGTRADGEVVVLVVTDTGIGMAADLKARIFDPFFTTKEVGQGTGLGLAVVHGIIVAHRGQITVESEPGQGSRFEIRIPASL
jgi:signal transduction histidine kinase